MLRWSWLWCPQASPRCPARRQPAATWRRVQRRGEGGPYHHTCQTSMARKWCTLGEIERCALHPLLTVVLPQLLGQTRRTVPKTTVSQQANHTYIACIPRNTNNWMFNDPWPILFHITLTMPAPPYGMQTHHARPTIWRADYVNLWYLLLLFTCNIDHIYFLK